MIYFSDSDVLGTMVVVVWYLTQLPAGHYWHHSRLVGQEQARPRLSPLSHTNVNRSLSSPGDGEWTELCHRVTLLSLEAGWGGVACWWWDWRLTDCPAQWTSSSTHSLPATPHCSLRNTLSSHLTNKERKCQVNTVRDRSYWPISELLNSGNTIFGVYLYTAITYDMAIDNFLYIYYTPW